MSERHRSEGRHPPLARGRWWPDPLAGFVIVLSATAAKRAAAGLAAYHAAITNLVTRVPADEREIIGRLLDDAAQAARRATEQLQR